MTDDSGRVRPGGQFCSGCGSAAAADEVRCPRCGAILGFGPKGVKELRVVGHHADEVQAVTEHLSEVLARRREAARLRSPWFSGLFYLTVVVVVVALLLVVGRVIALWALPVVIIGAVLLVSVVGAFQLRADDRLSERGFVKLMGDVLRRLPLVFARARSDRQEEK